MCREDFQLTGNYLPTQRTVLLQLLHDTRTQRVQVGSRLRLVHGGRHLRRLRWHNRALITTTAAFGGGAHALHVYLNLGQHFCT